MKVFLSYTKADSDKVKGFYNDLRNRGFSPWMDDFDLLPGMHWDNVIQNNMSDADVCLVFISKNSIDKIGYVQKELNYFAEKLNEMPESYIYCIPIVLDNATAPNILSKKIQYIIADSPINENWQKVLRSLELAGSQRDIKIKNSESETFEIEIKYDFEIMNGFLGYQFAFSYPVFKSLKNEKLADDLNKFIISSVVSRKIKARIVPTEIDDNIKDSMVYKSYIDSSNELENKTIKYEDVVELRMNNSLDSTICDINFINDRFVSLSFSTYWYGGGAAHGNLDTHSINFKVLDSKIFEMDFIDYFDEKLVSYEEISNFFDKAILHDLSAKKFLINKVIVEADEWLINGLKDFSECSYKNAYSINKQGWLFHFDPYAIDSFAAGKYEVLIPHDSLGDWYKEEFREIFLGY